MAGFDDDQKLRGPDFQPPTSPNEDSRAQLQRNEADPTADTAADTAERERAGFYEPSKDIPPKNPGKGKISASTRKKIVGGITAAIVGGGALIGLGTLPGITIVNVKEVAVQHFGANLETVLDQRINNVWVKKINVSSKTPTINPLCAKGISVGCRFTGMSDKEIDKLTSRAKKAGVNIEVETSGKKNVLGKKSIKTLVVNGQTMDAKTFASEIRKSNSSVRKAMQNVMKPRFATWIGAKVTSLMGKLGISKAKNVSAAKSVEDAKKRVKQNQQGVDVDTDTRYPISDDDPDKKENANSNRTADEIADGKLKSSSLGDRVRTNALKNLSSATQETVTKVAGSVVKGILITGYLDTACTVVNTVSAIGYMAKAIGALQLIRFAMTFANTADAIKAGEATNESIQALGEMFTSITPTDSRSAFDSYGYQWMAYGMLGDPVDTAEFRVGGGLPSTMTDIANQAKALVGGGAVCNFIQNPGVRIGSALVGIVAAIFSGGSFTLAQVAGNASFAAGLSIIQAFSMPLIADMVAGEFVNDTTVGNSAGNAFVSGMGALYAQNNNATALYPLTVEQAVAFDQGAKATYLAQTKADSVDETGQFDATNPNSFLGSLTTQLASTINSQSLADASGKLLALVTDPTAKTASADQEDAEARYKVCTDDEYKQLGIATDPFCNPVYGLSDKAMAMDPDDVIVYMYDHKYIDANGNAIGKYGEFLTQCVENTNPFGVWSEDAEGKIKPENCIPSKSSYPEEFWVYTIDSQVNEKMQCILEDNSVACGNAASNTSPVSGTCAANTKSLGTYDNAHDNGKQISIELCELSSIQLESGFYTEQDPDIFRSGSGGAIVGASVSDGFQKLGEAALAENPPRQLIGKGIRSYEKQEYFYNCYITKKCNNGNLAAKPGTSNHENGTAIDFVLKSGDLAWLRANGSKFGFKELTGGSQPEPWHWSPASD